MSFAKLKELIGDNSEALSIIEGLESTSQSNVEKINTLEKKVTDITDTRDKYKAGNSLVKTMLGLENVNEDTLKEYLNSNTKGTADEKLALEIENLKNQLSVSGQKYQELQESTNGTIRELKLGDTLNDLVGKMQFANDNARQDAINSIKSQISYDAENNPIFLKEDGTTKFNNDGKEYGLNDAVNDVVASKPYLFMGDNLSGGGSGDNQSGGNNSANFGGSKSEREQAIKEKFGYQ